MNDNETNNQDDIDVVFDEETPAETLKKLRVRLKRAETEKQEYLDALQRMKADVVNRDRSFAEEKSRISDLVKERLIEDLLPVLDAFDAAFSGSAWEKVDSNWRIGIEYIHTQFRRVLEDNGIKQFGMVNDESNPLRYDIASQSKVEGTDSGRVTKVLRSGYELNGRVIRPARVEIAE